MSVNECRAEVKLQALLNYAADRILLTQIDVVKSLTPANVCNLNLICKWGCDGTSGESTHKQKYTNDDGSKSYANFLAQSFHCNLYQTIKKQMLDLYGKIRGRPFLVFEDQSGSNFFTKFLNPLVRKWSILNSERTIVFRSKRL